MKAKKKDNTGKFKRLLRVSCSIDSRANKQKNCARAVLNDFHGRGALSLWTWRTSTRSRNETKSYSELRLRQRNTLGPTFLITTPGNSKNRETSQSPGIWSTGSRLQGTEQWCRHYFLPSDDKWMTIFRLPYLFYLQKVVLSENPVTFWSSV
jgi:hypothetical protein